VAIVPKGAPADDLMLTSVIHRRNATRRLTGLVKGFGFCRGAAACSISFETSDIVAVAADADETAWAVHAPTLSSL
jgi:adenine deaminase